jgi:thymidylate synthase
MILSFDEMDEAYPELVDLAIKEGEVTQPRGFVCRELRPFDFRIVDPSRSIYGGKSRKLSARFWAIETLSYLAGFGDEPWHAELLVMSNKGMASFVNEDTGMFDGAYGPRIHKSLEDIIQLLKRDPDTRQAVCSIWSPGLPVSKDVPCTVFLHFFRSHHRLQLKVYMRSNDLNWGLPYDIPAFCAIQLYVASRLGWPCGNYYHSCGSLHVYENETNEKGQPGPPNLARGDQEEWEHRVVPTITDLSWIPDGLRNVYDAKKYEVGWTGAFTLPQPWLDMIAYNRWATIG